MTKHEIQHQYGEKNHSESHSAHSSPNYSKKQCGEKAGYSGEASDNPLVNAANPLLNTLPQIRHTTVHPDPAGLRQQLIDEIRRFEITCQQAKQPYEMIIGARYCLCTALDEAAALTPWGSRSVWSGSGLLVTFHNETWGGEKFFQLLAKLSQNPKENLYLLELINFCLQLGFEGHYRVMDNGRSQLETLKQRLFQLIHSIRGHHPAELSSNIQVIAKPNKLWLPFLPVWACFVLFSFLVGILYLGFNWQLNHITTPVLASISNTSLPDLSIDNHAFSSRSFASQQFALQQFTLQQLDLQNRLNADIANRLVQVTNLSDRSIVTLEGDGLFNSASAKIKSNHFAVLKDIAKALDHYKGEILVIGYTDNIPIYRPFASNAVLSLARAKSVMRELQLYLTYPHRVSAEGKGASDPLVPNNSPQNRAKNRRVEITLLVSPAEKPKQGN
ncbi:MAG: DotU family type VI secretion system protein [Enterobacteriaceae bacterium]|jgi:type VI secretion system protein ImpK|nr:DotU family type VI secretion system protein [Enterobacteriaceae bacterium]